MSQQRSPSRLSNLLAALAIVGILGVFILIVHASNRETAAYQPSTITTGAEALYSAPGLAGDT